MKYQKQVTLAVGVVAVATLFFGVQRWSWHKLATASWPALDGGWYDEPVTIDGVTSLLPGNRVFASGVAKDGLPALTNPEYVSVLSADAKLADDGWGIDVEVGGAHRFYPYQILNWHEVVNDEFNGTSLAVTYCALCGTNGVYNRTVDGTTLEFGVSGDVYNNNTLLYDQATDSRWLQVNGLAVQGEMIGKTLTRYPSTVMTWGDWKSAYPTGEVLSLETGFARDYTTHPYGNYERQKELFFPVNHVTQLLLPKWKVTAYVSGDASAVFAHEAIQGIGLQTYDMADGTRVMALYNAQEENVGVFKLPTDDRVFSYSVDQAEFTDDRGNEWSADGVVLAGRERGLALEQLVTFDGYWFCVAAMYPDEGIAGVADVSVPDDKAGTIEVNLDANS